MTSTGERHWSVSKNHDFGEFLERHHKSRKGSGGVSKYPNGCLQIKMRKSKAPSTRRGEIQNLFNNYASCQTTLPACSLLRFLHKEQLELAADEGTAESLIERYEIEEAGEWGKN